MFSATLKFREFRSHSAFQNKSIPESFTICCMVKALKYGFYYVEESHLGLRGHSLHLEEKKSSDLEGSFYLALELP